MTDEMCHYDIFIIIGLFSTTRVTKNKPLSDTYHCERHTIGDKTEYACSVFARILVMLTTVELCQTLRRIPWFTEMNPRQLEGLANIATLRRLDTDDLLFREGERDDAVYILVEGQITLDIEVPTRGQMTIYVAEMFDMIGWSSLTPIARQRTATAHATRPSLVLGFNSKLLLQLCDDDSEVGYMIMRRAANVIGSRLLTTRNRLYEIIAEDETEEE